MGAGKKRRSAVASLGVLIVAVAAGSLSAPASSASKGPVVGGDQQAYRGASAPSSSPNVAYKQFYLTGTPEDQLNKISGAPSASFSTTKPTGEVPATQLAHGAGDADAQSAHNDPFTMFWSGPFSGNLDTEIRVSFYLTSVAQPFAAILAVPGEVTFWADPKEDGTATRIGRKQVQLASGPAPTLNEETIAVKGNVTRALVVQIRSVFDDTDVDAHYGSATFPSGFGIPLAPLPKKAKVTLPESVPVPYNGEKLALSTTDIGTEAGEPTIGVAKDGTAFMAAGKFPFADVVIAQAGLHPDIRRSTDGGRTWKSVQPKLPDGTNDPPFNVDPYVYVDPATNRVFSADLYGACSYLNYSDDKGETWTANPIACGMPGNDHQTIAAGPPPDGMTTDGYPNVVYYCVNQVVDSTCARSTDGGDSFVPTLQPAFFSFDPEAGGLCGGLHGHIIVDRDGRLFVPKGHCNQPWIGISEDGGDSWERVRISEDISMQGIQASVAADDAGNLYYVWWDNEEALPWLSHSTDHGKTWSTPLMIGPPGIKDVNWPTIDAGSKGRIAITFPGTTQVAPEPPEADPTDPFDLLLGPVTQDFRPWNYYVVVSTNALAADPLFLSATANPLSDPIHRGPCNGPGTSRCAGMFDFLDVDIAPNGEVWAAAVDTCLSGKNADGIDCVKKKGPSDETDTSAGATGMLGVATRQVGGPTLRRIRFRDSWDHRTGCRWGSRIHRWSGGGRRERRERAERPAADHGRGFARRSLPCDRCVRRRASATCDAELGSRELTSLLVLGLRQLRGILLAGDQCFDRAAPRALALRLDERPVRPVGQEKLRFVSLVLGVKHLDLLAFGELGPDLDRRLVLDERADDGHLPAFLRRGHDRALRRDQALHLTVDRLGRCARREGRGRRIRGIVRRAGSGDRREQDGGTEDASQSRLATKSTVRFASKNGTATNSVAPCAKTSSICARTDDSLPMIATSAGPCALAVEHRAVGRQLAVDRRRRVAAARARRLSSSVTATGSATTTRGDGRPASSAACVMRGHDVRTDRLRSGHPRDRPVGERAGELEHLRAERGDEHRRRGDVARP